MQDYGHSSPGLLSPRTYGNTPLKRFLEIRSPTCLLRPATHIGHTGQKEDLAASDALISSFQACKNRCSLNFMTAETSSTSADVSPYAGTHDYKDTASPISEVQAYMHLYISPGGIETLVLSRKYTAAPQTADRQR